jgi:LmbE family N-acetylglucosaminyl deacetylase
MRKLMAIFAHPDDEGAIGGTLTRYAQCGVEVTLVCATRGEAGQISDPKLATPDNLGAVRQRELEEAAALIGLSRLEFLGYRDSGMEGTPENEDPRSLLQAEPEQVVKQLAALMRQHQPDIVITFEPYGWYGHPDHIATGRWATEAYRALVDPADTDGDGSGYRPSALYHAVLPFSHFREMIEEAIEAGYIEQTVFEDQVPEAKQLGTEAMVTHVIDVAENFDRKQDAMLVHRTQFSDDSFFRKIPKEMIFKASGSEYFIQVLPVPNGNRSPVPVNDLFVTL